MDASSSGGWSRTNTHPASTGCSTLELHRIRSQRRRQESNLLQTGLQPVAWPSSPGVEGRGQRSEVGGRRSEIRNLKMKVGIQRFHPMIPERRSAKSDPNPCPLTSDIIFLTSGSLTRRDMPKIRKSPRCNSFLLTSDL